MTLTLPDEPALRELSDAELRTELACALYARGKVSAVGGSHLAGMDLVKFQGALVEGAFRAIIPWMICTRISPRWIGCSESDRRRRHLRPHQSRAVRVLAALPPGIPSESGVALSLATAFVCSLCSLN